MILKENGGSNTAKTPYGIVILANISIACIWLMIVSGVLRLMDLMGLFKLHAGLILIVITCTWKKELNTSNKHGNYQTLKKENQSTSTTLTWDQPITKLGTF